jgi:hypothetical protein
MVSFKTFGWRIVELFAAEQQDEPCAAYNDQCPPFLFWFDRMCDAMSMTLLHAQPTHSPELPRSVGRDVDDAMAGGRYG